MVLTTVVGLQPCSVTDIPVDLIRENIYPKIFRSVPQAISEMLVKLGI